MLSDPEAIRLCRTRQPSGKDIAKLVKWAEAHPAAEKVAPLLVLFTQWWALQQYDVPEAALCNAIARCAERGDEALWECIEHDYDGGRVFGAATVSLYMPDVALRLPRFFDWIRSGAGLHMKDQILQSARYHGVPVPLDVQHAPYPQQLTMPATFERRRAGWPKERDQLPLEHEIKRRTLGDEQAHALCRKFHPSNAEMRKVLGWAVARPDADKLRWIFLLCTDYQLGKDYMRWNDVADFLAAVDMAPVWEVLEGDWEYSRIIAAAFLVCRGSDRVAVERLMRLCTESETLRTCQLGSQVRRAAERLGIEETEAFRSELAYEHGWRSGKVSPRPSSGESERRKANWPAERERLPRPPVLHLIHDRRPELRYSTEPTELTHSLGRIREWLANANLEHPVHYRSGLTQAEISELAKHLPYVLTEELCELYRWADGTSDGGGYLIYYDFFKPLRTALEQDYQMMCDLNDREYPGTWKKKWFPVFNEGHDWWIQELTKEPRRHGPMMNFYLAGGTPERRYRSLTEMMFVWAECYDGGAFSVDGDGTLGEDSVLFEEIQRVALGRRGRR